MRLNVPGFNWKSRSWLLAALMIAGSGLLSLTGNIPGSPPAEREEGILAESQALAQRGFYAEAIALLSAALVRPGTSPSDKARIFHDLGYLLLYIGRGREALQNTQSAYEWARTKGLSTEAASFQEESAIQRAFAEAIRLRNSGDLTGSNAKFEEADRLARAAGSRPYALKIANVWSINFVASAGGGAKYLSLCLKALELADSLKFLHESSTAATNIAAHYARTSDYSRALGYSLKALNDAEAVGFNGDLVACLNNVAVMYSSLGDFVKAKDYLLAAAARVSESAKGTFETSLLLNLGNMFRGLGERLESEDYLGKAQECFDSYLGLREVRLGGLLRLEALAGRAGVYLDQGRLEEARQALFPALAEARRSDAVPQTTGRILSLLGELSLRSGDMPEARRFFEETRVLADKAGNPSLKMGAAYGLGRCAEERGDFDQAIDSYDLAVRVVDEGLAGIVSDIQRAEFMGRGREPFQALIRLYLRLSKTGDRKLYEREIFRLTESWRGRSYREFQDRLARNASRPPTAEDPEIAKLGRERLALLKSLSRQGLAREERERMESRVLQIDDLLDASVFDRYGAGDRAARPVRPISVEALQRGVLDNRTAVVEYLLGKSGSIVFCVTKGSLDLFELPPAGEIDDALTGFLGFLENPSIPAGKGLPAARQLYRILLGQVEPRLSERIDRLIIVPDGPLFRLPFEALAPSASDTAKPVYLGDRFVVSYAPSASSLVSGAVAAPEGSYAKEALVFGVSKYPKPAGVEGPPPSFSPGAILDDLYGRRGFAAETLPHVLDEIADLERRLPPNRIDAFEGGAATEEALKGLDLNRYRLIHLACHAFSDDNYPLRSALRLSAGAGDREDGYLQVSEMYDLRTNADLVVLSACQTGRGTIVMNEGNLGLPRVLFYMGARSVLSTLWPVNDKAAALFMKNFYDGYFRGLGKAEALREAQLAMRRTKFAHPYYWASYVLTGGGTIAGR
jgi:CHAT domain-containing protein/tetratricopeptide (TPR) repeat protein